MLLVSELIPKYSSSPEPEAGVLLYNATSTWQRYCEQMSASTRHSLQECHASNFLAQLRTKCCSKAYQSKNILLNPFKLFYAKKGKTNNIWKGILSPKSFKIVFASARPLIRDETIMVPNTLSVIMPRSVVGLRLLLICLRKKCFLVCISKLKAQGLLRLLEMPVHPGTETKEDPTKPIMMSLLATSRIQSTCTCRSCTRSTFPKERVMKTWPHSLMNVLINLPPASLHYLNLNSKKRRPSSSLSSISEMGKILLELDISTKKKSISIEMDCIVQFLFFLCHCISQHQKKEKKNKKTEKNVSLHCFLIIFELDLKSIQNACLKIDTIIKPLLHC
ncbi:hypothetical protein VP01_1688g1 [Puccinia sorghi]|uniref:Uncharacterized protein n=1 Tax=Puccinia sorghi TaxID=27349 RepID=A0A0L6VFT0_9BASI|nr:hypothetical protein VP01_1688g1 [Puccinia sorghi]